MLLYQSLSFSRSATHKPSAYFAAYRFEIVLVISRIHVTVLRLEKKNHSYFFLFTIPPRGIEGHDKQYKMVETEI